ncbi:MAG: ArnT family glycosyltransferase, partial [Chloroflexota bacterium]
IGGSIAVLLSFLLRVLTLAQPLVEAHSFRQTQTAYTAVIYHRDGIDLLQTPLPILGPPWVVPIEFPLFQAIAALVMNTGAPTEIALRGTSLAFFVVSVVLVWQIVRLEMGPRPAAVAVFVYSLAPLGLLWSRTSMVETMAVATSLAAVLEGVRWDRGGSRRHLFAAVALGSLAALLKITTAAIWLAPAVLLLRRSKLGAVAVAAVPAFAGIAWTSYTDAIKSHSAATMFLTSGRLTEWNFGTIAQRADPQTWLTWLGFVAGLGLLVLAAPIVVRTVRILWWSLLTLILGPLIFTNLYFVHDYYWMAVGPAAAILSSAVACRLVLSVPPTWRRTSVLGLIAVFAISFVLYPRWVVMFRMEPEGQVLMRAAQIQAATAPEDLVAIDEDSWSPAILFYADRRGYMEDANVPPAPPGYVRFRCPVPGAIGDCVRESS